MSVMNMARTPAVHSHGVEAGVEHCVMEKCWCAQSITDWTNVTYCLLENFSVRVCGRTEYTLEVACWSVYHVNFKQQCLRKCPLPAPMFNASPSWLSPLKFVIGLLKIFWLCNIRGFFVLYFRIARRNVNFIFSAIRSAVESLWSTTKHL